MALYLGSTAVKFGSATKTGTNEGTETEVVLQSKIVSPSTSLQTVLPDDGYNGLSQVTVNAIKTQSKSVTPTTSSQTVTPDSDFDGLSQVTVGAITTQSKSVTPTTSSQTVIPDDGYSGLSRVTVGAINNQSKSIAPSTSSQTIKPDSGYSGLSQVTVDAMPTGTLSSPSISIDSSTGIITATSGVTKAGYLSKSATSEPETLELTTHSGGTYTAGSSIQTIASAGTYLTGAIKLNAVSSGNGYLVAQEIASGSISRSNTMGGTYPYCLIIENINTTNLIGISMVYISGSNAANDALISVCLGWGNVNMGMGTLRNGTMVTFGDVACYNNAVEGCMSTSLSIPSGTWDAILIYSA